MLKMERSEVDRLKNKPVAAPVVAPDTGLADVTAQLAAAAQSIALAAQALQARPKQLDAVVRRDKDGRMSGLSITVI